MGEAEDVQASLDALEASWETKKAAIEAFIQSLKDAIAAAPQPGGLTKEQADAVIVRANALQAKIDAEPTA